MLLSLRVGAAVETFSVSFSVVGGSVEPFSLTTGSISDTTGNGGCNDSRAVALGSAVPAVAVCSSACVLGLCGNHCSDKPSNLIKMSVLSDPASEACFKVDNMACCSCSMT